MADAYQEKLRRRLQQMPIVGAPAPWVRVVTHPVGGLTEIGYAPNSDLLLVVSHQGRGLYDCKNGERLARDGREFWDDLDTTHLRSRGIGPLSDLIICLAGLHGGGLPMTTSDGWRLDVVSVDWPEHCLFLTTPMHSLFDEDGCSFKIARDGASEYRASGFSDTGQSFVFATNSDLEIYVRDDSLRA